MTNKLYRVLKSYVNPLKPVHLSIDFKELVLKYKFDLLSKTRSVIFEEHVPGNLNLKRRVN